jgi:hypothetical protein
MRFKIGCRVSFKKKREVINLRFILNLNYKYLGVF